MVNEPFPYKSARKPILLPKLFKDRFGSIGLGLKVNILVTMIHQPWPFSCIIVAPIPVFRKQYRFVHSQGQGLYFFLVLLPTLSKLFYRRGFFIRQGKIGIDPDKIEVFPEGGPPIFVPIGGI